MQHLIKALGITTVLLASSAYAETVSFPKNAALTYSGNGGVTATWLTAAAPAITTLTPRLKSRCTACNFAPAAA